MPWQPPPPRPVLIEGEVHVYRCALGAGGQDAVLTPEERERAARFRKPEDRLQFTDARAALRRILARYVDAQPEALRFTRVCRYCGKDHGKPRLVEPADAETWSFNLSHSGDLALIAVARGREVGVDVERVAPLPERDLLARDFLAPGERAHLDALPPEVRDEGFLRLWTRKEALLKTTGYGIAVPLDAVDAAPGGKDAQGPVALYPLDPLPGYVGALGVQGGASEVRSFGGETP